MPDVYWQIAAQRKLVITLTPIGSARFAGVYAGLCRVLARTFPKAAAILVRDCLVGFRTRSKMHVLLVEVVHEATQMHLNGAAQNDGPDCPDRHRGQIGKPDFDDLPDGAETRTTVHIVKIGEHADLRKELLAWQTCRPVGLTHHSVLMVLRPGAKTADGDFESIIYEDAHHVLGGSNIISLEHACLDCARWGLPSLESLVVVIETIFDLLGTDFYSRSYVSEDVRANLRRLRELLDQGLIDCKVAAESIGTPWSDKFCEQIRGPDFEDVMAPLVTTSPDQLQKSVNLERLRERLTKWTAAWADRLGLDGHTQPERLRVRREIVAILSDKRDFFIDPIDYLKSILDCREHCPLLLWGCSHGDLHGRNVLISLVVESATLPAIFDYEDMGLDNVVGWDFVKLETEIKVRALHQIYRYDLPQYMAKVREFELYLAERTHAVHDERDPRVDQFHLSPEAKRLAEIIMAIRKSAREHMGQRRRRDREWLEEYYFLLTCYGVYATRFDTYQTRDVAAALVSAGSAARLLARPWHQLEPEIRAASDEAGRLLSEPNGQNVRPSRSKCEMSHHARLAFATRWCRSGSSKYVRAAIEILQGLEQEYPHILAIEEELFLAYLKAGQDADAEKLLQHVTRRYQQFSEEMLCRFGSHWKGKAARQRKGSTVAEAEFREALSWYRRAFDLRGNYYPGINVAALLFVLNDVTAAEQVLKLVKQSAVSTGPGDATWVKATTAEVHLLECQNEEADRDYRDAVACLPQRDRESMRRQVELIVRHHNDDVQRYWTVEKLNEVFGSDTTPPEKSANDEKQT